ncbi:MAG: GNAT family N-acetyltransferase [Candidatus Hermodarchaeota archaeon]
MLKGKSVRLRGFELADAPKILEHFNDIEIRRFMDMPAPHSQEQEEQWIRNTWDARKTGRSHFYAIEHKQSKQLIGGCGLFSIEKINGRGELMIVLYNKEYWGQGFGTEALQLLLQFGFKHINLKAVFLYTHEPNKRAQRVYEKLGFKPGGRRRQASYFEGTYHDLLYYDLLASEFQG